MLYDGSGTIYAFISQELQVGKPKPLRARAQAGVLVLEAGK